MSFPGSLSHGGGVADITHNYLDRYCHATVRSRLPTLVYEVALVGSLYLGGSQAGSLHSSRTAPAAAGRFPHAAAVRSVVRSLASFGRAAMSRPLIKSSCFPKDDQRAVIRRTAGSQWHVAMRSFYWWWPERTLSTSRQLLLSCCPAWGTGGKEPQWVEVGFWPGSGICYRTGPIAHVCDAKRACRGCLTRAKPHRGIPPPGIRPVGLAPQDGVVGLFQLKGVAAATEDGKGGARIDGPQPK